MNESLHEQGCTFELWTERLTENDCGDVDGKPPDGLWAGESIENSTYIKKVPMFLQNVTVSYFMQRQRARSTTRPINPSTLTEPPTVR
jgi:hypothetical protein